MRWISLTLVTAFSYLFLLFPIILFNAEVIRWSVNPPVRLSGHRISAGTHGEDPLALHL